MRKDGLQQLSAASYSKTLVQIRNIRKSKTSAQVDVSRYPEAFGNFFEYRHTQHYIYSCFFVLVYLYNKEEPGSETHFTFCTVKAFLEMWTEPVNLLILNS